MKIKRIVIDTLLVALVIAIISVGIIMVKGQKAIESYSVNSVNSKTKVLIATQKSDFKDSVMKKVVDHYNGQDIYLSIIDVTQLSGIKSEEWDKIIIFSAIKVFKLDPEVDKFLDNQKDYTKIFMYNTSDSTKLKNDRMKIDTVASASKTAYVDKGTSDIINAIEKVRK